ncbi:metalloprotease [Methanosphaera sp. WGK6]|uniref:metalloprotease n=1 Tax=Methanosphaera sp. WGK6 TaxID=1561964 RepID=UPI00084C9DCC|nr:metalloprotease [Methanosphaera sp. WGK6]OED30453.1 metalloprotease [Methanosphaera sp. WGK6]
MVTFSKIEIKDLIISIIVITLLFAYIYSNGTWDMFIILIPITLVTVGLSFILHELGHKITAQHYGFFAEFRKWNYGLILAVITAFMGFIFLAPGAVYIGPYTGFISDRENGIISVAGPLINIILAVLFLGIGLIIQPYVTLNNMLMIYLALTCSIGFHINSFLALFNLLPIPTLDGSKVMKWNIPLWLTTIIISGILTFISRTITFF